MNYCTYAKGKVGSAEEATYWAMGARRYHMDSQVDWKKVKTRECATLARLGRGAGMRAVTES